MEDLWILIVVEKDNNVLVKLFYIKFLYIYMFIEYFFGYKKIRIII